jgi:hypothetical protein
LELDCFAVGFGTETGRGDGRSRRTAEAMDQARL